MVAWNGAGTIEGELFWVKLSSDWPTDLQIPESSMHHELAAWCAKRDIASIR
jgi:hypothetical protein